MEDLAKVYLKMMGISESLAMWSCEYNPVKDDEDEEVETNVPSMNLYQMHYSSIDDIEELLKKLEQEYAQAVRDTDIKIQARAAWAKRSAMFSVGALICYLVAGCTFFLSQTDWRLLDAMLFTVYTATSAGYGHLEIPATPLFHSFTMCFILFGGATLAVVVAQVYQYFAFESFRAEMYRKRSKLARDTLEKLSREASPEDRAKVKAVLTAHLKHWEKHLTSRSSSWKTFFRETKIGRVLSIVVPLSSTLLSGALIIGQIEGWAFIESLYFAVVSMAAVGYG